jgi:hypothetical protein
VTRQDANTNLVVLDREEHEAVRVLLEQWLVRFLRLDGRGHNGLLLYLRLFGDRLYVLRRDIHVLFASRIEAQLLDGTIGHLKAVNARRGLCLGLVNDVQHGESERSEPTCFDGVIWVETAEVIAIELIDGRSVGV